MGSEVARAQILLRTRASAGWQKSRTQLERATAPGVTHLGSRAPAAASARCRFTRAELRPCSIEGLELETSR